MEVGILGPFLLAASDGRELKASGRERNLLALLALHAAVSLSTDRLVDDLWAEDLPANPTNALQQRIFHARRTLAEDSHLLVSDANGYRLLLDPEQVDVGRFTRLRSAGQEALRRGDPAGALRSLQQALDVWRGDPLQGVTAPWSTAARRRLEEEHLGTEEELLEALLTVGRHADAIPRLEDLTVRHPLRERLRGLLMRALTMAGRQADALAVYERTRLLLTEELGLDPSPALRAIQADVLAQREESAVAAPPAPARTTSAAPAVGAVTLPAPVSSFVGRVEEVRRLSGLLLSDRVVTVTGPGGVGKTRVALEAARAALTEPAGRDAVLVELAAVVDPASVPSIVASAVGLTGQAGTPPLELLLTALQHRETYLLLDNCEHLLDPVSELVDTLLVGCANLRVLATSREPLGVDGEVVWPLDPLPVPGGEPGDLATARLNPAVSLLLDRVGAAAPDHEVTEDDVEPAVHIVRELDGLPLAIELAAARVRAMSLREIADRLQDRFALLAGGRRSAPARHRALTATLEWSWDLLEEADRAAWMAASVPAAPFTTGLLAPLLASVSEADPGDAVTALCDRSLLRLHERGSPSRYAMLASIREFGQQKLAVSAHERAIRRAHAAAVEDAVAGADNTSPTSWDLDLTEQRSWLPDVRAAVRWRLAEGDRRGAQRLAARLGWLAFLTSLTAEWRPLLDRTLGPLDTLDPTETEPSAVLWAAGLRLVDSEADGMAWAHLAAEVAEDPTSASLARSFVAAYRAVAGDVAGALELIRAEDEHDGWLEGMWRLLEGRMLTFLGDLDAAETAVRAAQDLLDGAGAWSGLLAGDILVHLAQLRGDAAGVRAAAERGLASCARHGTARELGLRCLVAMVEAADGQGTRAEEELARAEDLLVGGGPAMTAALLAIATGYVRWRSGRAHEAREAWTSALHLHWSEPVYGPAFARWGLGHLSLEAGDLEGAAAHFARAFDDASAGGDHDGAAAALEGAAAVAVAHGDPRLAAARLGAASVRRQAIGAQAPLLSSEMAATTRMAVRAQLGADEVSTAEAAGAAADADTLMSQDRVPR